MNSPIRLITSGFVLGATLLISSTVQPLHAAAADRESSAEKQRALIAILKSDAPPQEKAITCKKLAIYGDKEAVPAIAPLLSDPHLNSWARTALEAIPGPEADAALRDAVPKLQGRILIGTINSIGVRRDSKAVDLLAGKLKDSDADIVSAAAFALGKIGGPQAAEILNGALAGASKETRAVIAEGQILCAEHFLNDGKLAEAVPLYDAVRAADVPKQRRLEATRGAILARQSAGIPLLLEQLSSVDNAVFGIALRTARELQGRDVTEAIGAELDRTTPERQVMLVLALADRGDAAVLPKVLQVAQNGSKATRVATLGLLDRFGDPAAVPVLLTGVSEEDPDVSKAAKATLTRMEGKSVDAALLGRLPESSGKMRQSIIELAALRRIDAAVPAVMQSAEDSDKGVRRAALNTVGVLGTEQQAGDLVRLLSKTENAADRDAIEQALNAICGRTGARSLPMVLPLTKNSDSGLRSVGVRTLASIGGADALAAVNAALQDRDEAVQDEAVGTLATWPNNWPEDSGVAEPLLNLAKSGRKTAHQVQGARGYLLYLQENKKLSNSEKVAAIDTLKPYLKQPQQKRLAISTLGTIPSAKSLDALAAFTEDAAVSEEASLAIVNIATAKNLQGVSKEARQKALQVAAEKSKNEATRKKANDALKAVR